MFEMWFLTVFGLMNSSRAISALSLPMAISRRTRAPLGELGANRPRGGHVRGGPRPEALEELRRDVGRDQRLTARSRADPRDQLVDGRVLQQVAARAGHDGVHHVIVVHRDWEDDDARVRRDARQLARRLDAGEARHVQVHDDDVFGASSLTRRSAAWPLSASPATCRPCSSRRLRARSGRDRGRRREARAGLRAVRVPILGG